MATTTEESELDRVKKELSQANDMYLRALADFDNFRRRVERERSTAAQRDKRDLLSSLLDLLDSFDRAFEHAGNGSSPVQQGFEAIRRQLVNLLEAQGVTAFDSMGTPFDPELHEAVGSAPAADGQKPGTVTGEVRRGYRVNGELLRPARVRVAK